mmetsp:Transcript_31110/g.72799  ORF Transcript_31110/g.72799 Transcript_31110/m.72799 type:complete len:157 (+) Transcript_31110:89-559(+)
MLRSGTSSLLRAFTSLSVAAAPGAARQVANPLRAAPSAARSLYYSGSHYDATHMRKAKNPELPPDDACAKVSAKVFGTAKISNPHQRSVRKLLLAAPKGQRVVDWYPPVLNHNFGGIYEDPFYMRRQDQLERLRRRGKGPPKKGQGKRAKTKKTKK